MTKFLENAKAVASLVGVVLTALSATYHNPVLTIALIVATAFATWRVPNAEVD